MENIAPISEREFSETEMEGGLYKLATRGIAEFVSEYDQCLSGLFIDSGSGSFSFELESGNRLLFEAKMVPKEKKK